ncbi:MAG: 30S ribosomal protein S9 [Bacteroidetes bacterium]|jgi:small subunit ribosomal protein S9|nr:30S ribosomal protein S9 [Bacteroidota bacterium]MBK8364594.1 30S ribosomal protein S9 [Bacteroidota bacterium]MBK9413981.1 30S ribosomal protein S9 [Bacteroidota bacterium]MBL0034057.1 30S ribosomal protein S9 [Bacteroidota bacterium]
MATIHSLGRRKTSIARVYLAPGSGDITVNSRDFKEYFPTGPLQYILRQAQTVINVVETYDIKITVDGGGIKGQAEAARLGIARALVKVAEENKSPLRKEGLLTRDPRMVERKKPGQKKARKKFQFSKR